MILEELRDQIRALQAERHTLVAQAPGRAALQARANALVDHLVETGGRRMLAGLLSAPMTPFKAPADQLPALLVTLLGADQVKAAFARLLKDVAEALPEPKRRARLAEVDADLDRQERDEESMICRLIAEGLQVSRRPDARPEIVLE